MILAGLSTTQASSSRSDLTTPPQKRNLRSTVQRWEIGPSFTQSYPDYFVDFLNMDQKSAKTEEQSRSTEPAIWQKLPPEITVDTEMPGDTRREKSLNWSHVGRWSSHMVREPNHTNGAICPDKNY